MAKRRGWKWDAVNSRLIVYVDGTEVGRFDATVPSAYTQTYSTADRTHANPTASSVATTGVTQTTPYGYAGAVQGDAVATTINQIIVDLADLKQLVNAVIDDLQDLKWVAV